MSDGESEQIGGNASPVLSELKSTTGVKKSKRKTSGEINSGRKKSRNTKRKVIETFTGRPRYIEIKPPSLPALREGSE